MRIESSKYRKTLSKKKVSREGEGKKKWEGRGREWRRGKERGRARKRGERKGRGRKRGGEEKRREEGEMIGGEGRGVYGREGKGNQNFCYQFFFIIFQPEGYPK